MRISNNYLMNKGNLFILSLILFFILGCFPSKSNQTNPPNYKINLRWSPSFTEETKERAEIGLQWNLSYLGAMLPKGSFERAIEWKNDHIFTLDLSEVGFTDKALSIWAKLLPPMKASEEYSKMGGIDLGRFYLLTFNSSWHYYALTDVSPNFEEFKNKYEFEDAIDFFKNESGVAKGSRKVYQAKDTSSLDKMGYFAIEGTGDLQKGNFIPKDYEVFDFMPNGQPRFAIYDEQGQLKAAANPALGKAGKPSKCMWCHESSIQLSFKQKKTQKLLDFNVDVKKRRANLLRHQKKIETSIFYDSLAHHRNGEFPFGSFMESNIEHMANEFQLDTTKIKEFIKDLPTHTTLHFPEFNPYYDRKDIDDLQPYKALQVPSHMWESSSYEPNFLNGVH